MKGENSLLLQLLVVSYVLKKFMRKKQRTLLGCIATSFCVFAFTLSGAFFNPTTEETLNDTHSTTLKEVVPSADTSVTPTKTPEPTPTDKTTLDSYHLNFTVSKTENKLNIRSGPSTDDSILGKLPSHGLAYILEEEKDGWIKISTGSIKEGYISASYIFTEQEVKEFCDKEKAVSATVNVKVLNARSGPGTDYKILSKLKKGKTYTVVLSESFDGWLAIKLNNGKIAYVSEQYVKLSYDLKTGSSLEEIEEQERKKKEEEAKKKKEKEEKIAKARVTSIPETKREPMTMTDEELYLFATVLYTEAGDQGHDGLLAVANVILNRIEAKRWGPTLEDVLFAKGQFSGAKASVIEKAQKKGIPEACYKAAREALAGRNTIGDFLHFRMKNNVDLTKYEKFYILKDHLFY